MFLFMFDVQSKINPTGIGVPYRCSFTLQVREKNQSFRPCCHLACIVDQVLHALFKVKLFIKITELLCVPFKYGTYIVGWATRNITAFRKDVVKQALLFIL